MADHPSTDIWQQPAVDRTVRQAAAQGRLARTYLLTGPDGSGKWATAHWIARRLLCRVSAFGEPPCGKCSDCRRVDNVTHSDWHVLFPVSRSEADKDRAAVLEAKQADPYAVVRLPKRGYVTIDRVRALITELSRTSVEGGPKVVLIAAAEQMAGQVQAILLKSIEEPPPDTYFILTSSDPGLLLPTVVSRCQTIRFLPVAPEIIAARLVADLGLPEAQTRNIAALSGGGWGNAVRLSDDDAETWREANIALWEMAFSSPIGEVATKIDALFRPKRRSVGLAPTLEAFDVWSLMLRRDCAQTAGIAESDRQQERRFPTSDPESTWTCWRILQQGRATLFVNVAERVAVTGTFLALRHHLGCR